ncbi:MAG: DNA repair protein RecO [Dehalococcoidia bacterium]|jgi:DNA repair protein RecO (recombination protein O)
MPEPRDYKTEAIVIKKTKLGEADTILTFFTPHLGKIQGFARSLRKPKSKMAGHLELLTHSQISLARGKNLDTLTGSQTINAFLPMKNDLWLTSCGLYIAELVNQFTAEHQEHRDLFYLVLETLDHLCDGNNHDIVLHYFELHLLEQVGYRPQLRECVTCHRALEPATNYFSPGTGGISCPECGQTHSQAYPLSLNAQKVLRLLQDHDFSSVARVKIDPALADELEKVIQGYLRYLLERDLKSTSWLDTLREQRLQYKG